MIDKLSHLAEKVQAAYTKHRQDRIFTVAVSGIDAAGKGHISLQLQAELERRGYIVANINIDPWQNPISTRLQIINPARHFYENVFRWDDFFQQLIIPLQKGRSICLHTELIRTDADEYYPFTYNYNSIDILIIEGILLFQEKYIPYYDYKIWVDCSFETGLKRAIKRNAEKLEEADLVNDYHTYYYGAQRLHFERDDPKELADILFNNDHEINAENI
jgi:uridine kinase